VQYFLIGLMLISMGSLVADDGAASGDIVEENIKEKAMAPLQQKEEVIDAVRDQTLKSDVQDQAESAVTDKEDQAHTEIEEGAETHETQIEAAEDVAKQKNIP